MELLNERRLREMVYGGAFLGAGGGGSISAGLSAVRDALAHGMPLMVQLEELSPKARIVTLSIVGSVSKRKGHQEHPQHASALHRLASIGTQPIAGLIPSEVGPQAVTYGWRESITAGVPIVDAPCNGRAHPLALMGSLGLHRHPEYTTTTVAIGGSIGAQPRVEIVLRASVSAASRIVRQAAAASGLPLAVARNPLPVSYVRKHAAIGGLTYAQTIGEIMLDESSRGLPALLNNLQHWTGGSVLSKGRVTSAALIEKNGFTIGRIALKEQSGSQCRITVCNEYLALHRDGVPMAAFPDLITLFHFDSTLPLSSPEVKSGDQVAVFAVPRQQLKLGSTMNDSLLLHPLERLLNLRLRRARSIFVRAS